MFAVLLAVGLDRELFDVPGAATAAAAYLLSLILIARGLRGHRDPDGKVHRAFGAANALTLLRLGLVCWLIAWSAAHAFAAPGWSLIGVIVLAAALDAIDGPLARARGLDSDFGARFDMETDALLVLVLSVLVWRTGIAGPWVLLSGLMRYLFVALAWALPWLSRPLEPSLRRKAVCVLQIVALILALLPGLPPRAAATIALLGLAMLVASFAIDIAWLAARRQAPLVASPDAPAPTPDGTGPRNPSGSWPDGTEPGTSPGSRPGPDPERSA